MLLTSTINYTYGVIRASFLILLGTTPNIIIEPPVLLPEATEVLLLLYAPLLLLLFTFTYGVIRTFSRLESNDAWYDGVAFVTTIIGSLLLLLVDVVDGGGVGEPYPPTL